MKKINYIFMLGVLGLVLWAPTIKAEEYEQCAYGIPSPLIYANGIWRNDGVRKLRTTYNTCYGDYTSVTYATGSYLPMSGRFDINAILYEDDPPGNDDEQVKKYQGYNNGYSGITWKYVETINGGAIDSAGDNICELYMSFQVIAYDSEPKQLPQDLFRYTMCMK